MEKSTYLASWIEGTLSDLELEKLEGKESLKRYSKIKEVSSELEIGIPENLHWEVFEKQLPEKREQQKKTLNWVYSIAAGFVVLVGISSFILSQKIYTSPNSFNQVELSDGSIVQLAPGATLKHQRSFNLINRKLSMTGEAYFEVKKGSPFIIDTPNGTVEVIGTAFKIIDSGDFYKVICTEGKVKVTHREKIYFLTKGLSFSSITKGVYEIDLNQYTDLSASYYNRVPLDYVVDLVSKLYNINIQISSLKDNYFTGTINLKDQEKALRSISLPFSFKVVPQNNNNFVLIEE
jgi:ferric-dicitrate binding protein FerR (iron transport regulator)